jgi:RNA polymerase sigma factor (sigma-70 family)
MGLAAMARGLTEQDPERTLIDRCLQGDATAWEELYRAHEPAMFRVAVGILGTPDAAEEALQEAFANAFRTLARLQPNVPFRVWIHRSTVWACRRVATQRRRGTHLELTSESEIAPAEDRELRSSVRAAVLRLHPRHREVVVLRYFLRLSEVETAQVLRVRTGTVKSRTARALRKLSLDPGVQSVVD